MKRKKELEKYRIRYYSATKLFQNGIKKDGAIYCTKEITEYAYISTQVKDNCHLFEQTQKIVGGNSIDKMLNIFIIINFEGFADMDELKEYPNGFYLTIDNKEIHFIDFLKSNSMSKESMIYYINSDYYDKITPRIYFDYNKANQIVLSKWYAYSGLCLTDCYILDKIKLTFEEVAIIPDLKNRVYTRCITAVSMPLLLDKTIKLEELLLKHSDNDIIIDRIQNKDIEYLIKEIRCYFESKDLKSLPNDLMNIIKILRNATLKPVSQALEIIRTIKGQSLENTAKVEWSRIHVNDYPVEVNYFDGEGLISMELANEINNIINENTNKYKDESSDDEDEEASYASHSCGSFQIRLPFLKGMVHSCNFVEFFKSKGVTKIKGLTFNSDNPYYEYDVNKLKMIITESQFKAASFIKAMEQCDNPVLEYFNKLKKYDYALGISSFEPKKSDITTLNYQFLSTLPLSIKEIDSIIEYNKERLKEKVSEAGVMRSLSESSFTSGIKIYKNNRDFYLSLPLFSDTRKNIFESAKEKLMLSKLEVRGCRKLLCSDLLKLLYHCYGASDSCPNLNANEIYLADSNKYADTPRVVLLRNPHYSRNEIGVASIPKNENEERQKYFSHLSGVVFVNPTSLLADRLGGADYDGDTVIIVSHEELLNPVLSKLTKDNQMLYPIVKIPSISTKRIGNNTNSYVDRIECLQNTFSNKTGTISNIAFNKSFESYLINNKDSESQERMAFFTILGGLEIDSAKNGKKPALPKKTFKHEFLIFKDSLKSGIYTDRNERKTAINKIVSNRKQHPIFHIYYEFSNVLLEDIHYEYDLKLVESDNRENIINVIAIVEAYGRLKSAIKDYSNGKRGKFESDKAIIIKNVIDILQANKYDINIDDLISACELDNSVQTYFEYINNLDNPYHYMVDKEDKIKYIKSLNLNIPDCYLDALCNFNNGGYKLLFLLLKYHTYLSPQFEIVDDRPEDRINNNEYLKEDFKYITKKSILKSLTEQEVNKIAIYMNDIINDIYSKMIMAMEYVPLSISEMKIFVLKELTDKCKKLNFEDLATVINYKNTDLIYSVFEKQVVRYLKKAGEING